MHFIVLGAGAIGCFVGGRLASSGHQVSLVGRERGTAELLQQGLEVTDVRGRKASLAPAAIYPTTSLTDAWQHVALGCEQDAWVLVCTKATGTEAAAAEIAQSCPAGTRVLSLQNGVNNPQRLRLGAPQATVLAGMVSYNVNWRESHQVYQANKGALHVERSVDTEALAVALRAAGLDTRLHQNMQSVQWGKLLVNLFNPVNALANMPIQAQLMQRDYRRVFAALQEEALTVLKAANIQPTQIAAVSPKLIPKLLRLPNWLFAVAAKGLLDIDPAARTSMCVDLQNARPTEIDDLCGAVVTLAEQSGVSAPLNQALCSLVKAHQPGQDWSAQRLQRELGV